MASYSSSQLAPASSLAVPGSSNVAPVFYRMLEGDWPVLKQASAISASVMERIRSDGSGSAITSHYGYLSLGYFFIHTDLLEAHPTQRPISQTHVRDLRNSFDSKGLLRMEHPGVVIGLGDGWNEMKNGGPHHYMISNSCPHLSRLSATGNGPIGQIIRGNHRTAAIRSYARNQDTNAGQNYWYYQVLLPGTFTLSNPRVHPNNIESDCILSDKFPTLCFTSRLLMYRQPKDVISGGLIPPFVLKLCTDCSACLRKPPYQP